MIYLKEFETEQQYGAAKDSGLILPSVSLVTESGNVHYNPHIDPYNGHEYVDLGLPSGTKWATMNVGASSPTDYGNYYQYGKGADDYSVTSGQSKYSGTENPLALSADTANQVWGGQWHMPTLTQVNELFNETTCSLTTVNGIYGAKLTAQNDNYIFIPAAGRYDGNVLGNVGKHVYVWTSTPRENYTAYNLYVSDSYQRAYDNLRIFGFSVRAVID